MSGVSAKLDPAPRDRRRRKRRRNLVLWSLGSLFLLLIVLFAIAVAMRPTITVPAGEPVTLAELDAWYPAVPAEQNAALRLMELFESGRIAVLRAAADQAVTLEEGNEIPDHLRHLSIADATEQNAEGIDELHRILQMPASRYPIDLNQGANVLLPHLANVRELARCKRFLAVHAAEQGRTEDAALHLEDMWRLASTLKHEPLLISQLVRIAVHGIAIQAAQDVFSRATLTDEQLQQLATSAKAERDPDLLYRGLVGERALFLGSDVSEMGRFGNLAKLPGMNFFLENMNGMIEASRLPEPDRRTRSKEIADRVDAVGEARGIRRFLYMMPLLFLPALTRASEAQSRDYAVIDTLLVAVAIEQYKLDNGGTPPESLDRLVPQYLDAVPLDVYTGKPYLYRITPDGYIVYAVGDDERDDGGITRDAANEARRAHRQSLSPQKSMPPLTHDWPFVVSKTTKASQQPAESSPHPIER